MSDTEALADLLAERDRLKDALASKVAAETLLTGMHGKPGEFFIGLQGGAAQILAEGLASQLAESGAENYVELRFTSKHAAPDEEVVVTIQRVRGKSPHALRREAEAERDRLRAQVEVAKDAMNAAVGTAQWQSRTNRELNKLIEERNALRADVRELVEFVLVAEETALCDDSVEATSTTWAHLSKARALLAKHNPLQALADNACEMGLSYEDGSKT